jgi:hypothetical protein
MMVSQGQDPMQIVEKMATVIDERKKGTPLEEAVAKAFKPEPAEEEEAPGMEQPEEPMGMGGEMPPMQQGGRPAMQELLAGLTGAGNPVLAGRVTRQIPA